LLVALRSYKPELTATQAVQQLLSATRNGHLDAAAAFRAAGLGVIVDAGNAAIPKPPPLAAASPASSSARVPRPSVRRATWGRGVLVITLKRLPKRARLHAKITFTGRKALYIGTSHVRLRARVPLPRHVELRHTRDGASSATVPVKVTVLRR
jgi:hypothetical protein